MKIHVSACLEKAKGCLPDHPESAQILLDEALETVFHLPSEEQGPWLEMHDQLVKQLPPPGFTCEECDGSCCRNVRVVLHPEEVPWFTKNHPDKMIARDWGRTMELLYIPHPNADIGGFTCCFQDVTTGKCTIYNNRPTACRVYPVGCYGCRKARGSR